MVKRALFGQQLVRPAWLRRLTGAMSLHAVDQMDELVDVTVPRHAKLKIEPLPSSNSHDCQHRTARATRASPIQRRWRTLFRVVRRTVNQCIVTIAARLSAELLAARQCEHEQEAI